MIISKKINLQTKGQCDIIDITSQVSQELAKADVDDGIVTVFVNGSTAGVSTIEYEPGLVSDFKAMWERTIPQKIQYDHDRAWDDGNGHSHIRASLLGASITVPFSDKRLTLGTWQQLVLVDFDNRPRTRQIIIQIMGE